MALGFDDPVFVLLLGGIVAVILFLYFLARRTLVGLRAGYDEGYDRER
ncbi:MAG: hypothetical protein ABEJ61_11375 [Haloferacaceae archaeon]